MGGCVTKQYVDIPRGVLKVVPDDATVSLDKARRRSSNSSITSARYHCSSGRKSARERRLDDDYEVFPKKLLGEGFTGPVVMARRRLDGRWYALKRIEKNKVKRHRLQMFTEEVEIYLTLDHPHIAGLRDVYETQADISLLIEYCEGGELFQRAVLAGRYQESDAAEAARQMLYAVGYLHAHNIVHRDLKLQNFLYETRSKASPLKLIDFGFAKIWDPTTLMMACLGTLSYVSPDVLDGQGYTSQCDMWSLGVVVFMLLAGYPPFHGSKDTMRASILDGQADWHYKSRWAKVSHNAIDFVKALLAKCPKSRLDAKGALAHKWLASPRSGEASVTLSKDVLSSLRGYAEGSRLRRAILQLMAQELAPNEANELRELFLGLNEPGEGTIRLADLKDAIRGQLDRSLPGSPAALSPRPSLRRASTVAIGELFSLLDANGDQQIYYSDFLAATMDTRSQLRKDAVRSAFHRLDADGSGTISAADMRRILGESFEGVDMEEVIGEACAAGSREVTFDDFVRVLEKSDATPKASASQRQEEKYSPEYLLSLVP